MEWWDSRWRVRRLGEATVECWDGSDAIYETLALVHQAQATLSCVASFMNFVMRVRRHVRADAPVLLSSAAAHVHNSPAPTTVPSGHFLDRTWAF